MLPTHHRRAARALVALLAVGAAVSACATASPVGTPTAKDVVGTCKKIQTAEEMVADSDVSPAVPCTGPHVYETYALTSAPASITELATRPGPEILHSQSANLCPLGPVRPYLGAGDLDSQWGISIWTKFPTRAEWGKHLRVVVCDLVVDSHRSDQVPLVDFPLRDVMHYTDSARVRQCRNGPSINLTCDQPHRGEKMGSVTVPSTATHPARAAETACTARIAEYTGHRTLPGFRADAAVAQGGGAFDCWLTSTAGPVTGTERGGLVKR